MCSATAALRPAAHGFPFPTDVHPGDGRDLEQAGIQGGKLPGSERGVFTDGAALRFATLEGQLRDVALDLRLPEERLDAVVDEIQIQQVILNLIINAIEAMSGTSDGSRELIISTGKAESCGVLVAVRDSGPGLAPATLERIFDAFYTTKPNGMGLGLSIGHSIIKAHGGRLWAEANVPHGTIFQFTLVHVVN